MPHLVAFVAERLRSFGLAVNLPSLCLANVLFPHLVGRLAEPLGRKWPLPSFLPHGDAVVCQVGEDVFWGPRFCLRGFYVSDHRLRCLACHISFHRGSPW